MSKPADERELQALHDSLARVLAEAIMETEIKVVEVPDESTEEGTRKVVVKTRNAAVLNAARQFLKDNGIQCARGRPSKELQRLEEAYKLPFEGNPHEGLDDSPEGFAH